MSACPSSSMASGEQRAPGRPERLGVTAVALRPCRDEAPDPHRPAEAEAAAGRDRRADPQRSLAAAATEGDVGGMSLPGQPRPRRELLGGTDLGVQREGHPEGVEARAQVGGRGRHPGDDHPTASSAAASCETFTNESSTRRRPPVVDRRGGDVDAGREIGRHAGDHQRGGGVEHDDVPVRAVLAAEHAADDLGVVRRLAADQLLVRRRRQAELHRVDRKRVGAALVVEREHRRRPGRRQLVEPAAVHHPGVGGAVGAQRRQHPLGEGGVGDADEVAAHPAGIGHRPEQVEHRRDADLAPRRGGEAERGVEPGGEAEPDAGRLDATLHSGGRQLDGDAQLLQDVGGAALRRRAARPVLADRDPGAGDDEGRHRRHVDRVRPVATGADHVDRAPRSSSSSGTSSAAARTASSSPDNSSAVSPFARRATTNPISCAAVARPPRMLAIAVRACSAVRSRPASSSVSSPGHPPWSSRACSSAAGTQGM